MEILKTINSLNREELLALSSNSNKGIEYEYALFYNLLKGEEKELFLNEVILKHSKSEKINSLVSELEMTPLTERIEEFTQAFITTQNDNVGPADLVVLLISGEYLGVSVKYDNNVFANISGNLFLTESNKTQLKNALPIYVKEYVNEATEKFGEAPNWFRKSKKGIESTEVYIDFIRDYVISNWKTFPSETKNLILNKAFHNESPIDFIVVNVNAKNKLIVKERVSFSNNSNVSVSKHGESKVSFIADQKEIAQMQVKFNNGILERGNENSYDLAVDGIFMCYGNPITSWNINEPSN